MRGPLTAAVLTLAAAAWGQAPAVSSRTVSDIHSLVSEAPPASPEHQPLAAYPEHLVYNVGWGLLKVGQATMAVDKMVTFDGRAAYAITSEAKSNGFCDAFYKVRDLNESWIDAKKLTSLGYSKQLREGHFFRDEWVLFDDAAQTFQSRMIGRDGSFSVKTGTIPASVQDILSTLYYVRSKPLVVGTDIVVDVNTKENWPLIVRVLKKERVKTDAGRFDAVLVEPMLRKEGIFIQKGKKLQVWLSDDARKMPVLMKVEVFFGHITASLSKY